MVPKFFNGSQNRMVFPQRWMYSKYVSKSQTAHSRWLCFPSWMIGISWNSWKTSGSSRQRLAHRVQICKIICRTSDIDGLLTFGHVRMVWTDRQKKPAGVQTYIYMQWIYIYRCILWIFIVCVYKHGYGAITWQNIQIDTPLKFNNSPLSMFGIHTLAHKIAITLQKPTTPQQNITCVFGKKYTNFHHWENSQGGNWNQLFERRITIQQHPMIL